MSKYLVIVESPAKAKTIHKFLGKDYEVRASMGHVRDLPKTKFGIDIENDFSPQYTLIPSRTSIIKELSDCAKKSDLVFLATDLDREGEAIAWHLAQALKLDEKKSRRVVFNEITKTAIQAAFAASSTIQMNKVFAQQARRILDRIVGYKISPLLWEKITRGLSAGRVQSVAVKLIVEKEKEISDFKSEEYWKIIASFVENKKAFAAELKKIGDKKANIPNEKTVKEILAALDKKKFVVTDIESKEKSENPSPPFTTSLLQQQASIRLRFSTKHTMMVAQQLYEGLDIGAEGHVGLITYMRTDSVRVADEANKECRDFIAENFAPEYLNKEIRRFADKKAQGAHEAIRPTSALRTPEKIRTSLTPEQYKLYKLIWERFVATQMSPARYGHTTIKIEADEYLFEAKGKQLLFAGYTAVSKSDEDVTEQEKAQEEKVKSKSKSKEGDKEDNIILPVLKKQQVLPVEQITPSQHFTQPPPRYSEATLVKALEARGIGRPSTYAPIISTIQARGYVNLKERKFYATELGIIVTNELIQFFPTIMEVDFTSQMESKLDEIEEESTEWVKALRDFYKVFEKEFKAAQKKMESFKKNPEVSNIKCDKCQSPMVYKYNKHGKFLGCSSYPKCKNVVSLEADGTPFVPQESKVPCPKCGSALIMKKSKLGKFFGCKAYPECKNTFPIGEDGNPLFPQKTDELCELCGSNFIIKHGKRGGFLACSSYPACKNTKPLDKKDRQNKNDLVKEVCSKCNMPMALRKSKRGWFLGCTGYPKCRNLQRFSPSFIKLPPELAEKKCERCSRPMAVRYSVKDIFLGCSGYPECNFAISLMGKPAQNSDNAPKEEASESQMEEDGVGHMPF